MFDRILDRQNEFRVQFWVMAALSLFAGILFSTYFIASSTLYWDAARLYSIFYDNLHSLNAFGETLWWDPTSQLGVPAYYHSILATNGSTPLFSLTCLFFYLLGLAGIKVTAFQPVYVTYFGILMPFLFSFCLLLTARRIFRNGRTIFFVLLLGAFSPCVVFNLSDVIGLEQTVYSLFFTASWLAFLESPGRRTFILFGFSVVVMAAALNYPFFFWNILFMPIFVFATLYFAGEAPGATLGRLYRSVSPFWWLALGAFSAVCLVPGLIAYLHGADLVRTTLGTRSHQFFQLRPGNPLEAVAISTPGIGFEWFREGETARWIPMTTEKSHTSYGYLGVLALPLIFIGLVYGEKYWKKVFLFLITVFAGIVLLSGFSPVFSGILLLPTPLADVSHFSDAAYRMGIACLYILTAGLGLDAVLGERRLKRIVFQRALWASIAFSIVLFGVVWTRSVHDAEAPAGEVIFGFFLLMAFLFLVAAAKLARAGRDARRSAFLLLFSLTFLDVSTASFWHVRNVMWDRGAKVAEMPVDSVGTGSPELSEITRSFVAPKKIRELADSGVDLFSLPYYGFSSSAKSSYSTGDFAGGGPVLPYIALSEEERQSPSFSRFFEGEGPLETGDFTLTPLRTTYNELAVEVVAGKEMLFYWRDYFSPFWKATLNGNPVEIAEAFGAFKAVSLPRGRNEIVFRFSPGFLPAALILKNAVLALAALLALAELLSKRRRLTGEPPPNP